MYSEEKHTRRARLREIFEDTESVVRGSGYLWSAVEETTKGSKVYFEGDEIDISFAKKDGKGKIVVSGKRSFEAASDMRKNDAEGRIGVLNFASSTHPGGGVRSGAGAQEESLCRCSTLAFTLENPKFEESYYLKHVLCNGMMGSDDLIYSPDVVVIKSDDDYPALIPENGWFKVDVLTQAAPNLKYDTDGIVTYGRQLEVHKKRGMLLLKAAIANGDRKLVLGAYGCGAFRNDPNAVAMAYRELLDEYAPYFDEVEFAIFAMDYERPNYEAFRKAFS